MQYFTMELRVNDFKLSGVNLEDLKKQICCFDLHEKLLYVLCDKLKILSAAHQRLKKKCFHGIHIAG